MKVAILAGGFGTRLSEETAVKPKPMAEIGGKPILWHIMKIYAHHGLNDFVILGGYKVEYLRDYFLRYKEARSDFCLDMRTGEIDWIETRTEDWRVTVVDTGIESLTGGRIRRARHLLGNDTFCLTYGDGVSDVPLPQVIEHHRSSGAWCTLTAVSQPGRYGALALSEDGHAVRGFREKGPSDGGLINGGFFVCEPNVFDLIEDDLTTWEAEPMAQLAQTGKLASFQHHGYWQSMDTLRDKQVLEQIWATGKAPWKVWAD